MSTPTTTVAPPAAGTYRVDPATSTIAFTAKHMFGLGTVTGTFAVSAGEIVVAEPVSQSRVEATASAGSFDSSNAKRDEKVKSASFLDTERFPEISFSSTSLSEADGRWVLQGRVLARGSAAPVELTVLEAREDDTGLVLRATGKVDRYAHGISAMKGMAGRWINLEITAHATRG